MIRSDDGGQLVEHKRRHRKKSSKKSKKHRSKKHSPSNSDSDSSDSDASSNDESHPKRKKQKKHKKSKKRARADHSDSDADVKIMVKPQEVHCVSSDNEEQLRRKRKHQLERPADERQVQKSRWESPSAEVERKREPPTDERIHRDGGRSDVKRERSRQTPPLPLPSRQRNLDERQRQPDERQRHSDERKRRPDERRRHSDERQRHSDERQPHLDDRQHHSGERERFDRRSDEKKPRLREPIAATRHVAERKNGTCQRFFIVKLYCNRFIKTIFFICRLAGATSSQ